MYQYTTYLYSVPYIHVHVHVYTPQCDHIHVPVHYMYDVYNTLQTVHTNIYHTYTLVV